MPAPVAAHITRELTIPTFGIGAGPDCDGQVQVFHDMMGLYQDFTPKHARQYAQLGQTIVEATRSYVQDVESEQFPGDSESFKLSESVLEALSKYSAKPV